MERIKSLGAKKLIGIGIILIVLIALPVLLFLGQNSQDLRQRASEVPLTEGDVAIYLTPPSGTQIAKTTPFTVTLNLDTKGKQVLNFTVELIYDSEKFTYNSIQKGTQMDSVTVNPNITSNATTKRIRILAESNPSTPLTSTAQSPITVATLSFTTKDQAGSGTISFADTPKEVIGKNANATAVFSAGTESVIYTIGTGTNPTTCTLLGPIDEDVPITQGGCIDGYTCVATGNNSEGQGTCQPTSSTTPAPTCTPLDTYGCHSDGAGATVCVDPPEDVVYCASTTTGPTLTPTTVPTIAIPSFLCARQ